MLHLLKKICFVVPRRSQPPSLSVGSHYDTKSNSLKIALNGHRFRTTNHTRRVQFWLTTIIGKMFINGKIASTQMQLMHFVSISIEMGVSCTQKAFPPKLNSSRWLFVGLIFKPAILLPFSI